MNVIAAIEVASDAAGRQNMAVTLADIRLLYSTYSSVKAGQKIDIVAMEKAGTLKPLVAAAARTLNLTTALLADEKTAPHVEALIESIS